MFEVLEHPADIGFRAFGKDLPELFGNCAVALVSIAMEPDGIAPRHEYALSAAGGDAESLLVNWLSEVLYWLDGERIAFRSFRVSQLAENRVAGIGLGEPRDPARHKSKVVVKAVTYHQLKIAPAAGGWLAEVYLDI